MIILPVSQVVAGGLDSQSLTLTQLMTHDLNLTQLELLSTSLAICILGLWVQSDIPSFIEIIA